MNQKQLCLETIKLDPKLASPYNKLATFLRQEKASPYSKAHSPRAHK